VATAVFSLIMSRILGKAAGARGVQLAIFCVVATAISGTLALAAAFHSLGMYKHNVYKTQRATATARKTDEATRFMGDYGLPLPRATFFIVQNFRGTVPFGEREDKSLADNFAERSWEQAHNYSLMYYTDLSINEARELVIKGLEEGGYTVMEDRSRDPAVNSFYICGDRPDSFVVYRCIPDPLGGQTSLYSGPPQRSLTISIYETYADVARRKAGKLTPIS
jgi:hypothetical protein